MSDQPPDGISLVSRGPDNCLVSWSHEEEQRVVALVRQCLDAAGGAWHATVSHSAALTHCWVVRVARADGSGLRGVLIDSRAPDPILPLNRAVFELGVNPPS